MPTPHRYSPAHLVDLKRLLSRADFAAIDFGLATGHVHEDVRPCIVILLPIHIDPAPSRKAGKFEPAIFIGQPCRDTTKRLPDHRPFERTFSLAATRQHERLIILYGTLPPANWRTIRPTQP